MNSTLFPGLNFVGGNMKSIRFSLLAIPLLVTTSCLIGFMQMPTALACPCAEIPKPEAKGPAVDRAAGIKFTHTQTYTEEFDKAIASAKAALLEHEEEERVALVADIDETILDNRQEFENHPAFKWSEFAKWIAKADAPLLKPTADLLSWARSHGYAVFLITGRPEEDRASTIENLVRRGVAYDGLYMRPKGNDGLAEVMKTAHRKSIEDLGFKIVVNIGDQYSDLYGGNSIDCEKLPNKMYYIP